MEGAAGDQLRFGAVFGGSEGDAYPKRIGLQGRQFLLYDLETYSDQGDDPTWHAALLRQQIWGIVRLWGGFLLRGALNGSNAMCALCQDEEQSE